MSYRLKTSKKNQIEFFNLIKNSSEKRWKDLAFLCKVSERTLRDWSKGKYLAPYEQYIFLSKNFSIPLPKKFSLIDRFWYVSKGARLGGFRRYQLHGSLGNRKSRKKGGFISQQNRKIDPDKYRLLGCIVRKNFTVPAYSKELAELFGIFLGDGSVGNYQASITLDRKSDKDYAVFVNDLIVQVLQEEPTWTERDNNAIVLTLTGANLMEILEGLGLKKGNKVKNRIRFPEWILSDRDYRRACIRGLFDTDGGLYFHRHSKWKDKRPYLGWCFTSHSYPLLNDFYETLQILNIPVKKVADKRLYMYSVSNIVKYLKEVGSSNVKNLDRFEHYLSIRESARKISDEHNLNLRRGAPNW